MYVLGAAAPDIGVLFVPRGNLHREDLLDEPQHPPLSWSLDHTDTHHLHPLLCILDPPQPQLAPLLVLGANLVA